MPRVANIMKLARNAVFYQNHDGFWRVNWVAETTFGISDENDENGEEYVIEAADVCDSDVFHVTQPVTVKDAV